MNVLVLNLTRLGDLLQSQPALAGLKAQGCRIGLACLENFAPAAGLMQGVDELFPFPGARLLARLDADWRGALASLEEVRADIRRRFPPDLVINLTPSEPARLLALSLGPHQVRGFALDELGFNADTSLWAAFLQLAAHSRGASPFNIVDLFRRICGLAGAPEGFGLRGPGPEEVAEARASILPLLPAAPKSGLVALQLGASEDRRRWPVAHFAELARGLHAQGLAPVLVGTKSERPLGARLKELAGVPVADLMGETSLPRLAAVLSCCAALVTNDTGTMHLAAGLGVPSVAVFLATAQPWDTGPYLPGCLCLEPDVSCHPCAFGAACEREEACRQAIPAATALDLALALALRRPPDPASWTGARVWRTVIGADGLMDLESLSGHEAQERTRLIRLQRALYRRHLDGDPLDEATLPAAGLPQEAATALAAPLDAAAELLFLLIRQGEVLGHAPLAKVKAKFLATWQRVHSALETDARLAVLAALWRFESQRPGLDVPDFISLAGRFRDLVLAMRRSL